MQGEITAENLKAISADREPTGEADPVPMGGDLLLKVHVEFKKNAFFSTYGVELYLDDVYVASLPHGKDYDGVLLVSAGPHVFRFCQAGDRSVQGTAGIRLEGDAFFSCVIQAQHDEVEVRGATLN